MKNVKRLIILVTLVFVAGKVLFSDFELVKSEDNIAVVTNK